MVLPHSLGRRQPSPPRLPVTVFLDTFIRFHWEFLVTANVIALPTILWNYINALLTNEQVNMRLMIRGRRVEKGDGITFMYNIVGIE